MKKFFLLLNIICICQVYCSSVSANDVNNKNNETRTVKKELQQQSASEMPSNSTSNVTISHFNVTILDEKTPVVLYTTEGNLHINNKHYKSKTDDPDALKFGIYLFAGLGFMAIIFITYRSFRLRTHRAERRYGPLGHHSNYELTPLPLDEDSDNDDQTLFDLNQTNNLVN